MSNAAEVLILEARIAEEDLQRLVQQTFGNMVKYVVDMRRGLIAIGGHLHADGELALLERGSGQQDLWGANYYPGRPREECIEYTSLINIRPADGNPGMAIVDEAVRAVVRELTYRLVGEGSGA